MLTRTRGGVALLTSTDQSAPVTDRSYEKLPRITDSERCVEPLGKAAETDPRDLSALIGMPDDYAELLSEYVQALLDATAASPIMRRRYYHKDRGNASGPYPDDAHPMFDRDVVVPLVILPRPEAVERWSGSAKARSFGWRTENQAFENRGSTYGRSVLFQPGKLSENPISVPAAPLGAKIPSWTPMSRNTTRCSF
jgi:hypothetical protein